MVMLNVNQIQMLNYVQLLIVKLLHTLVVGVMDVLLPIPKLMVLYGVGKTRVHVKLNHMNVMSSLMLIGLMLNTTGQLVLTRVPLPDTGIVVNHHVLGQVNSNTRLILNYVLPMEVHFSIII